MDALTDHWHDDENAETLRKLTYHRIPGSAADDDTSLTGTQNNGDDDDIGPALTKNVDHGLTSDDGTMLTNDTDHDVIEEAGPALTPSTFSGDRETASLPPAFGGPRGATVPVLRVQMAQAAADWLTRTPSVHTRRSYSGDLQQFFTFAGIPADQVESLAVVRPGGVAAWRDKLQQSGMTNSSIRRKLTTLRSLFSYLQTYGYTGANPAHGKFVKAPSVSRDGKTVGLTPKECRLLLDAPDPTTPAGRQQRALLAVLAYTGCRVGELCRLKVSDYRSSGGHHVLTILGKGNKERTVPLHPEAFERLNDWLDRAGIHEKSATPLFRPTRTARGQGRDGFRSTFFTTRAIERLVEGYVQRLKLDPAVTVHSLRVTALTTARERGSDIIDLQDFAGHADPRTTLTYIRSRDRLSKSPAYVLSY